MKVVEIKAHPSTRAKTGGSIKISYCGQHHVIKAVVFSRQEADVLRKAADNASIVRK
jgi:hypothetical protein